MARKPTSDCLTPPPLPRSKPEPSPAPISATCRPCCGRFLAGGPCAARRPALVRPDLADELHQVLDYPAFVIKDLGANGKWSCFQAPLSGVSMRAGNGGAGNKPKKARDGLPYQAVRSGVRPDGWVTGLWELAVGSSGCHCLTVRTSVLLFTAALFPLHFLRRRRETHRHR